MITAIIAVAVVIAGAFGLTMWIRGRRRKPPSATGSADPGDPHPVIPNPVYAATPPAPAYRSLDPKHAYSPASNGNQPYGNQPYDVLHVRDGAGNTTTYASVEAGDGQGATSVYAIPMASPPSLMVATPGSGAIVYTAAAAAAGSAGMAANPGGAALMYSVVKKGAAPPDNESPAAMAGPAWLHHVARPEAEALITSAAAAGTDANRVRYLVRPGSAKAADDDGTYVMSFLDDGGKFRHTRFKMDPATRQLRYISPESEPLALGATVAEAVPALVRRIAQENGWEEADLVPIARAAEPETEC